MAYDEAIMQIGIDAIPGGSISEEPTCWCENGNDTCVKDYGVCQEPSPCLVRLCLAWHALGVNRATAESC